MVSTARPIEEVTDKQFISPGTAAALASLPSADEVGATYSSIGARIDAIASKAEQEGSPSAWWGCESCA
jgi:hypothetical protein